MDKCDILLGHDVLNTLATNLPDMLWIKDLNGCYLFANKALCDNLLMAESIDEPLGKDDAFFINREQAKHKDKPDWYTFGEHCSDSDKQVIDAKQPLRFEEFGNVKGKIKYYEVHKAPFFDAQGNLLGTVGSGRDITEMVLIKKELEEQKHFLDYQAHHDTLTHLPNRLLFQAHLEQSLVRSQSSGQKVALFFIDLDHFKNINDAYGHERGDEILQIVTDRILQVIRKTDKLCRIGGDEFALIVDDYWQFNDLTHLSNRILKTLKHPIVVNNIIYHVSASIGISINSEKSYTFEDMIKYADTALYRAKDNGRNTFEFYTNELTEKAFKRVQLESELRIALKENQLRTFYQPKVDLITNQISGMECLIRWQHPTLGLLSPDIFIPLAEESGLIVDIDRWIFQDAIKQFTLWQEQGLANDLIIALNVSCRQCEQTDLLVFLTQQLNNNSELANAIELEITETMMMKNVENAVFVLKKIKNLGFNLAIDDFGTGYSSLAYLKKLSATTLKIDQSFVKNLPFDKEDCAIVKAVLAMAEALELHVVAEGIETEQQLHFLQQQGCKTGQGYIFSKPLNKNGMEQLLIAQRNGSEMVAASQASVNSIG